MAKIRQQHPPCGHWANRARRRQIEFFLQKINLKEIPAPFHQLPAVG